jgi:Mycothiol maleylpyruvate isomerase N-terminal domain
MPVTADDLDAAVSAAVTTLRPATGRDWSVPAGALEWDCWHTAEHLGDVLLSYAGQLVAQPTTRYLRFMVNADKDASAAEVLEFAEAGGRILAATVRISPPQVRAYHPTGMADPTAFAGMGCVEALVHGHDIAQGLGLALDPPREVCTGVLARMFPHTVADLADLDPWTALLWATGRIALPGRPRVAHWRWYGAPPSENG